MRLWKAALVDKQGDVYQHWCTDDFKEIRKLLGLSVPDDALVKVRWEPNHNDYFDESSYELHFCQDTVPDWWSPAIEDYATKCLREIVQKAIVHGERDTLPPGEFLLASDCVVKELSTGTRIIDAQRGARVHYAGRSRIEDAGYLRIGVASAAYIVNAGHAFIGSAGLCTIVDAEDCTIIDADWANILHAHNCTIHKANECNIRDAFECRIAQACGCVIFDAGRADIGELQNAHIIDGHSCRITAAGIGSIDYAGNAHIEYANRAHIQEAADCTIGFAEDCFIGYKQCCIIGDMGTATILHMPDYVRPRDAGEAGERDWATSPEFRKACSMSLARFIEARSKEKGMLQRRPTLEHEVQCAMRNSSEEVVEMFVEENDLRTCWANMAPTERMQAVLDWEGFGCQTGYIIDRLRECGYEVKEKGHESCGLTAEGVACSCAGVPVPKDGDLVIRCSVCAGFRISDSRGIL